MNRKHVSKVGKYISMACLLFACATVQSCRDEYFYDDSAPDFLEASIYDYLKEQGDFELFLKVVEDLNYHEVLKRTGSKTLFVANDEAFKKGIKDEWAFDSYDQLTPAHKRIILNSAMLDNAYLLEMLSKMQSTGDNAEPIPGQSLRQTTSLSVIDTIGLFGYEELPQNNPDWESFRDKDVRLALDASTPMLVHFIEDQLYMKNITENDLRRIVGDETAQLSDIYVFDKKVIRDKSDVACKNGYVHQLDGLLIPPSNMAEELRKNGLGVDLASTGMRDESLATTTKLFSRILDRFAVPVPIEEGSEIAQDYNRMYRQNQEPEQLFQKKYYTTDFLTYVDVDQNKHDAIGSLLFDPGWNAYQTSSTVDKKQDMAAIFAPSDEAMITYFKEQSGKELVARYGSNVPNKETLSGLVQAIDSIPLDIIQALARNHMQKSFNATVPSKFTSIVNDARDDMKLREKNVVTTLLANNGVIYVMDSVYSPARYVSVIAPVMLSDTLSIFNKAIVDKGYDKYLLSMQNRFGLMVTDDNNLVYYDPSTEKKLKDRIAYKFVATVNDEGNIAVDAKQATYDHNIYDPTTNSYGTLNVHKENKHANIAKLYEDIMEYNIVIGELNSQKDRDEDRKYYMSKGYGTVMVDRDANGFVSAVAGGRERQLNAMVPVVQTYDMDNGETFQLTTLIQPPTQSVLDVLSDTLRPEFSDFYALCVPNNDVLTYLLGAKTDNNKTAWNKYSVFDDASGLVRMFDTYHYTVYVPSNEALAEAYTKGLPTWDDLADEHLLVSGLERDSLPKLADDSLKTAALKAEIKERKDYLRAGADLIAKFVRYHFQDNSVYVDNPPHSLAVDEGNGNYRYEYEVTYETSALNDSTNAFCTVLVKTEDYMGKPTISVRGDFTDEDYNVCHVINTVGADENRLYNVMTRDIVFSGSDISTSSYAVVHLIDGFLVFGGEAGIFDEQQDKFIR